MPGCGAANTTGTLIRSVACCVLALVACGRSPLDLAPSGIANDVTRGSGSAGGGGSGSGAGGASGSGAVDAGGTGGRADAGNASVGTCAAIPFGAACSATHCEGNTLVLGGICDGHGACAEPRGVCAPFGCDPVMGACRSSCTSDADCDDARCVGGSCASSDPGIGCAVDADCATGHCAGGVCCDTACQASCMTCTRVGLRGRCSPVPAGVADPRGVCRVEGAESCRQNGTCDGKGGCGVYPSGTACSNGPICAGDGFELPSVCDGHGICAPGRTFSCAPFTCDDAGSVCRTFCVADADCATGTCRGGSCSSDVARCTSSRDCANGFCADGVCCHSACAGPCVACDLPGTEGTCLPVPAGAPNPHALCRDRGAATCGTNGLCDGDGACATYAPGTTCSAATCVGGTLSSSGTCNALMACIVRFASCAPYSCDEDAPRCHSECSSDAICVAGFYCGAEAVCVPKKPPAAPCQRAGECLSNACAPGIADAGSTCAPAP